jgi:hypothetical protein
MCAMTTGAANGRRRSAASEPRVPDSVSAGPLLPIRSAVAVRAPAGGGASGQVGGSLFASMPDGGAVASSRRGD